MLVELSIKDFAIIDDLRICLSEGLNVLTGETGAGKSIIVEAVSLLLGSRATPKLIRTGADSAQIEALFRIRPGTELWERLETEQYDLSDGLVVQRIISRRDRHRVYINGRLATMQMLSSITGRLASISGQHAHQELLKEEEHLWILDRFGALVGLREKVSACHQRLRPLIQRLETLKARGKNQAEQREHLEFEKNEIEKAAPHPEEDTALEAEKRRLKNAEVLYEAVRSCVEDLYESQGAVAERVAEIHKRLTGASAIDAILEPHARSLESARIQVEETAAELRDYVQTVQFDQQRLEEVEARLNVLGRLKRKYGGSLETVRQHLEEVEAELGATEGVSAQTQEVEAQIASLSQEMTRLAGELSTRRKAVAGELERSACRELATLGMARTRFEVELRPLSMQEAGEALPATEAGCIDGTGMDRARFLIAPNVGEPLKPLRDIASGGELSRVVLALMAILARGDTLETVVFDEVDAGIGGEAAGAVGKKLSALARVHQVICITHLPQIACFGRHHLRITKAVHAGRTTSRVEVVEGGEREREIARMLGAGPCTETTLRHAQEMLQASLRDTGAG